MEKLTLKYVDDWLGSNPARVNLDTKVVEINAPLFNRLTPLQKNLILAHEAGHVHYDTVDNEILADRYALELMAGSEPQSLRKSVDALLGVLADERVPESRKKAIIVSALKIDAERFGNEHAQKLWETVEQEGRTAYPIEATAIAAIVMAAIALIGLLQQTIFGERAKWFKGDMGGKKKTQYKIDLLEDACNSAGAKAIKLKAGTAHADGGYSAIIEQINNESWFFKEVHVSLYDAFKDNNIFSPAFFRSEKKFYGKVKWVKGYIREYLPTVKQKVRDEFVKRGYQFKGEEIKTAGESNGSRWIIIIVAALAAWFLFKRR